jgi:PAS domain S-box-containing protein
MRIKKRFRIQAVVSLLIAFFIGIVLVLELCDVNKANNSAKIADNIITSSLERVLLRNDYLRSNRERAKDQWFDKNIQISKLLKSASEYFQSAEDKKIIGKMIESQDSQNELFLAIVANRTKNSLNARLTGLPLEVEERLLNQLNISAYEGVIQGRALQESSREARTFALRLASGYVILALLAMIATAMISLWSMDRVITDRVNRLCGGAVMIGDGDLDHRIDMKGDDEFFELSVAFNAMAAKLSGSYHDLKVEIEERKQTEEAMRQSEERLALAASATQIGMFDWNLNSGIILWTHMHEAIFGYVPTTITAITTDITTTTEYDYRKWADRVHPEDLPLVEDELHRCQQDRKPLVVQYRIIWPDASLHWVETKGVYQFDGGGKANRLLGVVMDITERKRAEEETRQLHEIVAQERDRLSALLNSITDEIWFADSAGKFTLVNPSGSQEFALNTAGKTDVRELAASLEVLRADGSPRPTEEAPPLRALRGEIVLNQEELIRTPALGELRHRQVSSAPVRDAMNNIIGSVSVVRDITERKQAEEKLKKSEQRFRLATDAAQASLLEKEVLLKEIHHRVKNNLQVISSLVNLQANTIDDPTVLEHLRDVSNRVRSMALVHEKLYQSANLSSVPFDDYVSALLQYLIHAHGNSKAGIRFIKELQPVFLWVETAVPCGLILNELISNTLKHAFRGRSHGEVRIALHRSPDGTVCLCVSDDGVGLPPELDWRQSESLGLRLVQMLTRQLNATMELNCDNGTEFQLTFKLPEVEKDGGRARE